MKWRPTETMFWNDSESADCDFFFEHAYNSLAYTSDFSAPQFNTHSGLVRGGHVEVAIGPKQTVVSHGPRKANTSRATVGSNLPIPHISWLAHRRRHPR